MIGQVVRRLRTMTSWAADRSRRTAQGVSARSDHELQARSDRVRLHLGRGRRARDAGQFERGAREARLALLENAGNPWAYALLGQCLVREVAPDLAGARLALERACALDPTNGYFVRLLLEVLDAQGDREHRESGLARAWWAGAPVERWLTPAGPRRRSLAAVPDRVPVEPSSLDDVRAPVEPSLLDDARTPVRAAARATA